MISLTRNWSAVSRLLAAAVALAAWPLTLSGQVVEYYHLDGLGSVRAVTNQAGQVIEVVERHDYLPWGEEHLPGKVCPVGPPPESLPDCQPVEYTGKERDAETELDYFGARYYAAKTGRFTAIDPVYNWNENLLDPQRWNRYSYGRNNPLRYVDPDGRDVWDAAQGVANAFGSNFFGGAGRQTAYNGDYAEGQFYGDVLSIPVGLLETAIGAEATGGGAVGAPVSGGATLSVSAVGVAMVAQGGVAASTGAVKAGIYLSKNGREGMGFTKAGKRQIDQANAEKYGGKNVCENCGTDVAPGKQHEKGVRPPGNERQRDHIKARSKGGRGVPDNGQVLCRECNIDKSNN